MTTVTPKALNSIYDWIDPYFKTSKRGGIANPGSPGYHTSREDLKRQGRSDDYSIQCPADKRGNAQNAAGIDITFGDLDELITMHKRLRAACTPKADGSYDPRIECVREIIGTLDGQKVSGYNRVSTGSGSRSKVGWVSSGYSDSSHLWHEHVSVLRDRVENDNEMRGLAEVMAGVPKGKLGWKDPDAPPVPEPQHLPPYVVTASEGCWEINIPDGALVVKRPKGYRITDGTKIVTLPNGEWLVRGNDHRLHMPNLELEVVPPKDPEPDPLTYETFLCANGHRSTDPDDNPPYAKRKTNLMAAVKSADATVIMVQEMTPLMRDDLTDACGYEWFAGGNVAVGWKPDAWVLEHDTAYDLTYGADDRHCIVVVLKHTETGREVKAASTHLTNLEGPDGGDAWRVGQAKQIMDQIKNLDMLGGDFNASGPVFDYFADEGLLELADQTDDFANEDLATVHHYGPPKNGSRIDSILTRNARKVKRAWLVRTDTESKYPNATDHQLVAADIQI